MGNSMQGGSAQTMQQSYQPSFMSQPNYGYQNPYANIFANLSQQQSQLPQAPINMPSAPVQSSTPNMPVAFDQTANNLAAGLPAAGQAPPSTPTPGAGAPVPPPPPSATSTNPTFSQFWADPNLSRNYDRSTYTPTQRQNIYNKLYPTSVPQ